MMQVKQEVTKLVQLFQAKSEVAVALGDWLNVERNAKTPLSGSIAVDISNGPKSQQMTVSDALEPMRVKTADHALYLQTTEDQVEQCLLDGIRFEIDFFRVWLEHLDGATKAVTRMSKAQDAVSAASEASAKNHGSGPYLLKLREARLACDEVCFSLLPP